MTTFLLRNGALLDPTHPDLLEGFEVLIEDGFVREVSDKPIKSGSARVIDVKGKTIMPGLIDLHVHVVAIEFNLPRVATLPNVLVTLRAVPIMRAMLRRGFTTVRDAGRCRVSIQAGGRVRADRRSAPLRVRPRVKPDRWPRRSARPLRLHATRFTLRMLRARGCARPRGGRRR